MEIRQLAHDEALNGLDDLVMLLRNAVNAGASIGFLPPLDDIEARAYWRKTIEELHGRRVLFAAFEDDRVVGCVQLSPEPRKNGDHRAEVQKLMVHTDFRRRGIGDALMKALIDHAQSMGLHLLVLDVRAGDPAERIYQAHGFIHIGTIPDYARNADGGLDPSAFYYRIIR